MDLARNVDGMSDTEITHTESTEHSDDDAGTTTETHTEVTKSESVETSSDADGATE
jgi:hypothetical protein